jgi:hypothetical protein
MTDQRTQQEKPRQPDPAEIYGAQGNEGQYGQGQYDSEGKPDPHGPQAQNIHPDDQAKKKVTPPTGTDKQDKTDQQKSNSAPPMD